MACKAFKTVKEKPLRELIEDIEDDRQSILLEIYDRYRDVFHFARGSGKNHQAWTGGYADHIADCLRINEVVYDAMAQLYPLDFSKGSAGVVLFFHDIEKLFRYGPDQHAECVRWRDKFNQCAGNTGSWDGMKWQILEDMKRVFSFSFSEDEINALKYTHGEGADYSKDMRVARPLAAHVHHCDNTSARIWPELGKGGSLGVW